MLREMQQVLESVNAAGVGAWEEVKSQGTDVVESLAANIQVSYDSMAIQLRHQVRVICHL